MVERDGAKGVANKSGCTSDWLIYCKLRNDVTKLNKKKKKLHYEAKINGVLYMKLWAERNIQLHLSSNQMAYETI